jgi:ParB family chromosome partitioning protein
MSELNVRQIEVGCVRPHPDNREFEKAGEVWRDFKSSVYRYGVVTPLLVRAVSGGSRDEVYYEIIAGERRWEASCQLGNSEVPCVVRDLSDSEALELIMVENLQREDIDPMEEARGVRLLVEQAGLSSAEVAERICKSPEWVELRQGLLLLPEEAQARVRSREVGLGVLQMVLHLPEDRRAEGLQMVLHPAFQDEPLNARQTERVLEESIIAPARAKAEWEARRGELLTHWTVELRKMAEPGLDPLIVQVADFEDRARGQYARDWVYTADLSGAAPKVLRWLHLAQRHGVPVKVYPGKVADENEKLADSVAMVDEELLLEAEKALEEHEEGAAWLLEAVKAKPASKSEKLDPDAREDQAEVDREEAIREVVSRDPGMSAMVDLGRVREASRVLMAMSSEDFSCSEPDWFPPDWDVWNCEECAAAHLALEWVLENAGAQGGEEEE